MSKLTATDWTAIKWYKTFMGYTMRDMMAWPMVAFRDTNDKKVLVNLMDIKAKYAARKRAAQKGKVGA